MTHRATPADWDFVDKNKADVAGYSCIMELHYRLEALESQACAMAAPAPPPAHPLETPGEEVAGL